MGEGHYFCDLPECDVTDINSLRNYLADKKDIKFIVNCAAGRDAELLENNYDMAYEIAVKAIKNIALCANEINAAVIHFSSDYVFDGQKSTPYTEEDEPDGLSVYGKTKILGEKMLLATAQKAVVFRIAWLLSRKGKKSFINTMINLMTQGKDVSVVFDQVGSPTVAKDAVRYILNDVAPKLAELAEFRKLYHLTNEGVCSWYDLAHFIKKTLNLAGNVRPIFSYEYPTKAMRPSFSVLSKRKISDEFGLKIRHFSEGLEEILRE